MATIVVDSTSTSASSVPAVAQSDLIGRIRGLLEDNPVVDYAAASITNSAGDTSLAVDDYTKWSEGDILEWDDASGEQARLQITPASSPLTLVRAANGTTISAHADDVALKLNPRFGDQQITDNVAAVVDGWLWDWVWTTGTTTLTPSFTQRLYEMPDDFIDVVSVIQQALGSITSVKTYAAKDSGLPVVIQRGLPAAISASGVALDLRRVDNDTNTILVTYRTRITTSNVTDDEAAETVINGTIARMYGAKDVPRSGEDNSLGDATVVPGQMLTQAARYYGYFIDCRRRLRRTLLETAPPLKRG